MTSDIAKVTGKMTPAIAKIDGCSYLGERFGRRGTGTVTSAGLICC